MKAGSTEEAVSVLRSGGVLLVPTETVVGIVAAEAGVLNGIKGSDPNKPIALLCASAEGAFGLASEVPPLARRLADLYWPGALTLVLDAPNGKTVGVRVPAHSGVRALLFAYGGPLYATSANPTGEPAPGALSEVSPRVLDAVDMIIEGEAGGGEASAVVDLSGGKVRLLRDNLGLTERTLARIRDQDAGR